MQRRERVFAIGSAGLMGVLLLAWQAPAAVGLVLMLFSFLVFVLGVVGLLWPSLMKLPNRMAAVWIWALSFGMFVGGGMLLSPQNGNSAASDASHSDAPRDGSAVTASTWTGSPWPFTEDAGTIMCDRVAGAEAVFFVSGDGKRWPLNGIARSNVDQFEAEPVLTPIWRRNPEAPDSRVSVGPMISFGRDVCRGVVPRHRTQATPSTQTERVDAGRQEQETDPCGYIDRNYNAMSPAEMNQAWEACLEHQGYGPEDEAAEYLQHAANCLELTRPRLLGVFTDPNPELMTRTIARACLDDPHLSSEARTLADQAVQRIDDWNDLADVDDEEQLDFVLGNIIAAYEREAGRLADRQRTRGATKCFVRF